MVVVRLVLWAATGAPAPVADDQHDYLSLRDGLLATGRLLAPATGLPTAFRDPGWPAFLAALAAVAGRSIHAIVLAQVLLQAITGALLVDLARRSLGTRAARVTAVLYLFDLSFATYTLFVYTESLAALALVAFAWSHVALGARQAPRGAAAAGALAGALGLVRASALPLAPAFALGSASIEPVRARAWIIAGLAMGLVLGAWSARNHAALGTWSLNTNGAMNAYIGNNEHTPLVHGYRAMTDSAVWQPFAGLSESARAARASRLAWAFVRSHPGLSALRALARLPDALEPDRMFLGLARRGQFPARPSGLLMLLGLAILVATLVPMVLAFSAVLAPPAHPIARAGAATFSAALLLQALTIAHPRFTQPAWLLLLPGAAVAWVELRAGNRARLVATAVSALALGAIAVRQFVLR